MSYKVLKQTVRPVAPLAYTDSDRVRLRAAQRAATMSPLEVSPLEIVWFVPDEPAL